MSKPSKTKLLIAIHLFNSVTELIFGPFLVAYFFKTHNNTSLIVLIYNLLVYLSLALISNSIVCRLIKKYSRIRILQIGVFLHFCFTATILLLHTHINQYVYFLAIFYSIAQSFYWMPLNLLSGNIVERKKHSTFSSSITIVKTILGIVLPILLGFLISESDFYSALVLMSFITGGTILAALLIKDYSAPQNKPFNLKLAAKRIITKPELKRLLIVDILHGFSLSGGVITSLIPICIYNINSSNLDIGLVETISMAILFFTVLIQNKLSKNKKIQSKMPFLSGIAIAISLFAIFLTKNPTFILLSIIAFKVVQGVFNVIYTTYFYKTISNHKILKIDDQPEFIYLRELSLNAGRVISYILSILLLSNQTLFPVVFAIIFAIILESFLITKSNSFSS